MKKHHSTLSRRDFLKALGLGGAGATLAASAPIINTPNFRDLDEVMASPEAGLNRPSWVKQVDKPTAEIDWQMFQRFDYGEVMFGRGFEKAMGQQYIQQAVAAGQANTRMWITNNKPGFTLKEYALNAAARGYAFPRASFLGYQRSPTPEMLGVPRWEGTPEENARLVRTVMRLLGADEVSYLELDENTEKLFYTYDIDGKKLDMADVENPEDGDEQRIIPKRFRWVIVYTTKMSYEMVRRMPSWVGDFTAMLGYAQGPFLQDRFQDFVRTLGYTCLGECSPNALGSSTGFSVMSGLGEMCRIEHTMNPKRGLSARVFKMVTDLPLAPTKPIDTGVKEFCKTCKKCTEVCPAKAISASTEPTWQIPGPWKRPGVRGWFKADPLCISYWRQSGTSCGLCLAECPLNRPQTSSYFSGVRSTIARTTAFNRTFRRMDDMLGWGHREDLESFWDIELPPYGWD